METVDRQALLPTPVSTYSGAVKRLAYPVWRLDYIGTTIGIHSPITKHQTEKLPYRALNPKPLNPLDEKFVIKDVLLAKSLEEAWESPEGLGFSP